MMSLTMHEAINILFKDGDYIGLYDSAFQTHVQLKKVIETSLHDYKYSQFFCINPLRHSRKDSEVARYSNFLLEFDSGSIDEQKVILDASPIKFCSITYSGNKSLHAIVSIPEGVTAQQYAEIADRLLLMFPTADKSCKNPSRLSRTPAAIRSTNMAIQGCYKLRRDFETYENLNRVLPQLPPYEAPVQQSLFKYVPKHLHPSTLVFLEYGAAEGARNRTLFAASCDLFRIGYTMEYVMSTAGEAGLRSGLSRSEVKAAIQSAKKRSAK